MQGKVWGAWRNGNLELSLVVRAKETPVGAGGGRGCHWKDTEAVLGREGVLVGIHTGCGVES